MTTTGSLSAGAIALAAFAFASGAKAGTVAFSASLSALPSNASVELLDLGRASSPGLVASNTLYFGGGNTIDFSGTAGLYNSTKSGVAAAPYTATGPQLTNYFAAEPSGAVTFNYVQDQQYFGLNWGSVDSYNSLSFYEGSTLVASYTGSQITSNAHGSQSADGSDIVNFNFSGGATYNKVVMTTTTPAFEFDTVAFSTQSVPLTGGTGPGPTVVKVYTDAAETHALAEAPLPALGSSLFGTLALAGAALAFSRRSRALGGFAAPI